MRTMMKATSNRPDRLKDSDPRSPRFPNHIRENPDALVGHHLMTHAVKRGYNPDGYEHLKTVSDRNVRDTNEDGTIFTYETEQHIGEVTDYNAEGDTYTVLLRDVEIQQETGEWPNDTDILTVEQTIPAATVRSMLKEGERKFNDGGWWVER